MKILDLQLKAFGPFTEKTLDFSSGGFHIVFGPNEAGKSSALRAISNFLYGIPARSTDSFIHENKALRIGATLECAGGRKRSFIRRKGNKDTLLDAEENPCADSGLDPFLGKVGEDLFLHMFGLSHQRLIAGGKEIVQGKGDVGQSIFAAGLGVAGLRRLLDKLAQQEADLFKPAGQNPEINRLLSTLANGRQELRGLSLSPRAYKEAAAALQDAESRRNKLTAELSDLLSQIAKLDRIQKATPKVARLETLRKERETLGEVIVLAEDFSERRKENQKKRRDTAAEVAELGAEIAGLRASIDSHQVDDRVLELESEILDLFQSQGAYLKNRKDLPALKHKRHNLRKEAQRLLRKLGLPDDLDQSEKLRLTHPQKARIATATDEVKSLRQQMASAEKQIHAAETEIAEAQERFDAMPPVRPVDALQGVLKLAAGGGDLTRQRDDAIAEIDTTEDQAKRGLKRLVPPAAVALELLDELPVPSTETIKRFHAEETRIDQKTALLEEKARDIEEQRDKLQLKIDAVKKGETVPTEEQLAERRSERDRGWCLARRSWEEGQPADKEAADAYEDSVRKADQTADDLRRESDRVAQLQQFAAEQQRLDEQLFGRRKELNAGLLERESWQKEWRQVWESAGVASLSPAEMLSWRSEYDNLTETCAKARELRVKQEQLDNKIEQLRQRLAEEARNASLPDLGKNLPLTELIARCEEAVEAIRRQNNDRQQADRDLAAAKTRLARDRKSLDDLQRKEKAARENWGETVAPLGLPASSAPEEAQAILSEIGDVFQKLDETESIEGRTIGIEKDCRHFEENVASLLKRLGEENPGNAPPQEIIGRLHQRLTGSRANLAALKNLRAQVQEKDKRLSAAKLRLENLNTELGKLIDEAGVENEAALPAVESGSEKARNLDRSAEALREQLLDFSGGGAVEEVILEVRKMNTESLPGEIQRRVSKKAELEAALTRLNEEIGVLRRNLASLDGSAAAAIKAEELEETVAALRAKIEEYARVRLGSILLRREIERYRQKHQGPVLRRAGEIFARLTLGSFSGLATDFDDKDEQILIGLRDGEKSVTVDGMSEGSCDQLYLALRLASLEHHIETNEPMPLILDDILVNFDDERSRATLEVLAEISAKNQVVYFTHHRHIVEIAQKLFPAAGKVLSFHTLGDEEATSEDLAPATELANA